MEKLNKSMLNGKKNEDLFYSITIREYIEYDSVFFDLNKNSEEGMSLRTYNIDNSMDLYIVNGTSDMNKLNKSGVFSHYENYKNKNRNENITLETKLTLPEFDFTDIFKEIWEIANTKNIPLKKIFWQKNYKYFEYINSSGFEGNGYEYAYSPGILIYNEQHKCNEIYYKSVVNHDIISVYKNILDDIDNDELFDTKSDVVHYTYLTPSLFIHIIRCLIRSLNMNQEQNLRLNQQISKSLTIIENSIYNKSRVGDIDEDGCIRKEIPIIEDGRMVHHDSKYDGNLLESSSVRKSYRDLPSQELNKMMVKNGDKLSMKDIKSFNNIMVITSIQGLEESYNAESAQFQAMISYHIYNKGENIGCGNCMINNNIYDVLNRIISVTKELEYEDVGKILLPGVLIEGRI